MAKREQARDGAYLWLRPNRGKYVIMDGGRQAMSTGFGPGDEAQARAALAAYEEARPDAPLAAFRAAHPVGSSIRDVPLLKGIPMPDGRYDNPSADVLIMLPPGYPDACPDMFYLSPWVKLKGSARYPTCADVPHDYCGRRWQRWSRHSSEWRPGIDGLHTMLARVHHALETAR